MSRRSFIEGHGATCKNWTWSWAFVNRSEKFVIFGAWDTYAHGTTHTILHEDWEFSPKSGRTAPGFAEAVEYIRLVESGEYALRVFRMHQEPSDPNDPHSVSKIAGFEEKLIEASLVRGKKAWLAVESAQDTLLPGEASISEITVGLEGERTALTVDRIERSGKARAICIRHHGLSCSVCKFDFEDVYGVLGRGFIEIHHLNPLAESEGVREVDPISDLVPVCPNCHRMLHRSNRLLTPRELREIIQNKKSARDQ